MVSPVMMQEDPKGISLLNSFFGGLVANVGIVIFLKLVALYATHAVENLKLFSKL